MSKVFKYRPIPPPNKIRILTIRSGKAEDPICVSLHHASLSEIHKVEALSYQWGSTDRNADIFCRGKIIKVTSSLVAVLKRLRRMGSKLLPKHPEAKPKRYLWIDAICIDQDNTKERSEQVNLMGKIYSTAYRVIVWVGEQMLTREAYQLMLPLARHIHHRLNENMDLNLEEYLPNKTVADGTLFKDLPSHPLYDAITDFWASCTVFTRIWTTQEVALAAEDRVIILYGQEYLKWSDFHRITKLVCTINFLRGAGLEDEKLIHNGYGILARAEAQYEFQSGQKSFTNTLIRTQYNQGSDMKDRVFGILGMADARAAAKLKNLSYEDTPGKIFRVVSELALLELQNLQYLSERRSIQEGIMDPSQPSWIWWLLGDIESTNLPSYGLDKLSFTIRQDVQIEGSTLKAYGAIVETIAYAYDNFSSQNFDELLLNIHYSRAISTTEPSRSWRLLLQPWHEDGPVNEDLYYDIVAYLTLCEWRRSLGIETQQSAMSLVTEPLDGKDCRKWRGRLLTELCEMENDFRLDFMQEKIKHMQSKVLREAKYGDLEPCPEGRNIFLTSNRCFGLGVFGSNCVGAQRVVRVGDKIAIFPKVNTFLILRPCGNQFKVIGPAFIPDLRPSTTSPIEIRLI